MSHLTRGPVISTGIDSKAIADGNRHDNACIPNYLKEVPA
jgi:hypothetical protein